MFQDRAVLKGLTEYQNITYSLQRWSFDQILDLTTADVFFYYYFK